MSLSMKPNAIRFRRCRERMARMIDLRVCSSCRYGFISRAGHNICSSCFVKFTAEFRSYHFMREREIYPYEGNLRGWIERQKLAYVGRTTHPYLRFPDRLRSHSAVRRAFEQLRTAIETKVNTMPRIEELGIFPNIESVLRRGFRG